MQLAKWQPSLDIDDFFDRNWRRMGARLPELFDRNGDKIEWSPSADISETKKEFLIKAELPDVDKDDIHVSVLDGALTIEGERKHHKEEEDETYHRVESFYGSFMRSFPLPSNVDESKIKAESKNGILKIHMPKTKESAPAVSKEIKVN